jgi:sensor histidine kinase YesM
MWRRQLISAILIFLLGSSVHYFAFCPDCLDNYEKAVSELVFAGMLWALLWKGSEFWVELLDRYSVSWVKAPFLRFAYSVLTVVIYSIVVYYLIYLFIAVIILGYGFSDSFRSIDYTDYLIPLLVTLGINLFMHGRGFLMNWRQHSIDNQKLKTEHVASQLISLKDQINPHFLFNSLNALSSLVYDDQKKAVKFIRKLSEVYRYVLDQTDKELVTVEEELTFMESYFYLLKIRFEDNLIIKTNDIKDSQLQKMIPPMSLQLLVENAIKHNVVSDSRPLTIDLFTNDGGFLIVKNNVSPKKALDSKGIGLNNLKMRYQYLSDKRMIVNHTTQFFEVYLPLLEIEE